MDTEPPKWRVSVSASWTATELVFSDDAEGALRRSAASVSGEYRVTDEWTLTAGAGASIVGRLTIGDERFDLGPGPLGVVGASYRIYAGEGWIPFLLIGGSGSVSSVKTESALTAMTARMTALDLRISITAGEVFADTVVPYATLRGFGGPVIWERNGVESNGSDKYHYQLGLGLIVTAGWFDASLEVVPLGERSVNIGAGFTF